MYLGIAHQTLWTRIQQGRQPTVGTVPEVDRPQRPAALKAARIDRSRLEHGLGVVMISLVLSASDEEDRMVSDHRIGDQGALLQGLEGNAGGLSFCRGAGLEPGLQARQLGSEGCAEGVALAEGRHKVEHGGSERSGVAAGRQLARRFGGLGRSQRPQGGQDWLADEPALGAGLGLEAALEADIVQGDMAPTARVAIPQAQEDELPDQLRQLPDDVDHLLSTAALRSFYLGAIETADGRVGVRVVAAADHERQRWRLQPEHGRFGHAGVGVVRSAFGRFQGTQKELAVLAVGAAAVVVLRPIAVEGAETALDDTPAVQAVLKVKAHLRHHGEACGQKTGKDAADRHVRISHVGGEAPCSPRQFSVQRRT